ncbi:hypothetical protein [Polaromonas sp.]|uniref:hypothetical protein n=1 Tax=Polaromonas sp. TaxID=1869339 RepID=UPI00286D0B41|nr:hypothetical protein [Polaromonas sp.]
MKPFVPYVLLLPVVMMLAGCPDAKVPKAPPNVPEPKASVWLQDAITLPAAVANGHSQQELTAA